MEGVEDMHNYAKTMMECLKSNIESIGKDNLTSQQLEDMKNWAKIACSITTFEKDYDIIEAMKKSGDSDEIMEKYDKYAEEDERRYYNSRRYANGRYAPSGRGRRMYHEPMEDMIDREAYRDMDYAHGRMYYTGNENMGNMRNMESGTQRAKRYYTESKKMHNDGSPESRSIRMGKLDEYLNEIKKEMGEVVTDMTPEEKSTWKTRLTNIAATL